MNERIVAPISPAEFERRWKLVRDYMEANRLDAVVTSCDSGDLSGYIRWLTGGVPNYRRVVIFHRSEPMTLVDHGNIGAERDAKGTDPAFPGVGMIYTTAQFQAAHYTQHYEAELAVKALNAHRYSRIGLINEGCMPYALASRLRRDLVGNPELVDVTEAIDGFMVVKSAEEQEWIRKTCAMQDAVFARVLEKARPGMKDFELTALAQYEGRLLGAETGILLGRSAPLGTIAPFAPIMLQGRTVKEGDYFPLLIENNGPGGYFAELSRVIVFGRASNELLDACAATNAAQEETLKHFTPGTPCSEIFAAFNRYNRAHGLAEEKRIYAHGQGYNLVERPLVRDDEPMKVEAGMNFAVHPTIGTPSVFVTTCDNYLIGPDGAGECLHKTEKRVFEV